MQITILGNSNCLLTDGWVRTFREELVDDIILNLSVGGSTSPALLYQLCMHACAAEKSDIIIIEPTVVDHGTGWQSPALISTYAEATLEKAKTTNTLVLLLVLPRNETQVVDPSPGMIAWSGAAKRAGVPIIDIRAHLLEHAQNIDCDLATLWRDDMGHLTIEMQAMISSLVIDTIQTAKRPENATKTRPNPYRALSGAEIAHANGIDPIARATSLMSIECAPLSMGKKLILDLHESEAILGFMLNYGAIDHSQPTILEVSAKDGSAKQRIDLRNKFLKAKPSKKLVAMFRSATLPPGHCQLEFLDRENPGADDPATNFLEFVGIFIGPKPVLNTNWQSDGIRSLD